MALPRVARHVQLAHNLQADADQPDHAYVMKQGERDDRMFIVVEGAVRLSRLDDAEGGEIGLGRASDHDYFGELAVLLEEAPGLPFPRARSAHAVSSTCTLASLAFGDVAALREASPRLDAAVAAAAAAVLENRPSLRPAATAPPPAEARLARVEAKLDGVLRMHAAQAEQLAALGLHLRGGGGGTETE